MFPPPDSPVPFVVGVLLASMLLPDISPLADTSPITCSEADGFVVPIRDANALAKRLRFFYEHPEERMRMGRTARDYVQQFTWQNYHREVIEHYDAIMNQRG